MNGHESLLHYINKSVPSILNYNTPGGINILHIAAAKGHFGCFTYLLQDAQLDPSVTTKDDLTCLHFASAYDNVDIVKYLLDLKSEICITKVR
jgi:ankyrin repeat protein